MNDMVLFDYQEDMVTRVQEAFSKHRSVMVQMPTGTGKTYLLAAVVNGEERRTKNPCVWIVAHRRELVEQIEETLARFGASFVRVMSIQWLSRHWREMNEEPSLIVIDEAHHAVADTYAEVMRAFPKAKKLGLTATPYRMSGNGFTVLFDVLLTSWNMERFIAEGRLSLYDYYSIKPNSTEQQLVDSLKKRGADGDYQLKEMNEMMDVRPSLERLCTTVKQYVPQKKGIVYAISIAHAGHIADFYRQNGIHAVAISSKTPTDVRKAQIGQFKKGEIQVLVSVDLFSEGFDCPDVEFIQLARPTLSLSKYLQMVGRGLRVAKNKDFCVILDNVGLYRRFGLPSAERDWQSMFAGRCNITDELQAACMRLYSECCRAERVNDYGGEMKKIACHEHQLKVISYYQGFRIEVSGNGKKGVVDKYGKCVVECKYRNIVIADDAFALCLKGKTDRTGVWVDLRNGLLFHKRPKCIRILGIDFATDDGRRLYPRIRSKFIDDKAYLNMKTLLLQVGTGLSWKRRFIPWDNTDKVYMYKGGVNNMRLYYDDDGNYVAQENIGSSLIKVVSQKELDSICRKWAENYDNDKRERKELERSSISYTYDMASLDKHENWVKTGEGLAYSKNNFGDKELWIDMVAMKVYCSKPTELFTRGFVKILRLGEWCYVRNIPDLQNKPFRDWEIVADNNICVINNEFLFLKQEPRLWFKIFKRTDDFSFFVVKEHEPTYKNYIGLSDIIITQFGTDCLKMEKNGVPYTPHFQPVRKALRGW